MFGTLKVKANQTFVNNLQAAGSTQHHREMVGTPNPPFKKLFLVYLKSKKEL
jgi:hypothetical protein